MGDAEMQEEIPEALEAALETMEATEVPEGEAEKAEEAQPEKPKRKKRAAPNVEKQSNYIGVHWSKKDGKWLASRSVNGKSYFGGTYATEIEAARQSDALLALHGGPTSKGRKNFGAKPTKTIVKRRKK